MASVATIESWINDAVGIGEVAIAIRYPALAPIAFQIATAVGGVEAALGAKTGLAKLAAVEAVVPSVVSVVNTIAGSTLVDPTALGTTIADAVQAVVDVANLFNGHVAA